MILKYVKIEEDWDDLKNGSSVIFDLPTSKIYYTIYNLHDTEWWWLINDDFNGQIFRELKINEESFVESVVGYSCGGDFPEVRSLDDLKKVIKALDDECVKKFGTPDSESKPKPKFKVGDKVRILPRQGSSRDYRSSYTDDMLDCGGKTTTIVSCKPTNLVARKWPDDGYVYKLEDFSWSWNSSMLELVEDSDSKEEYIHPSKLKDGDIIKICVGSHKGFIYIFKGYTNNNIYRYVSLDLTDNILDMDSSRKWGIFSSSDKITYATEEEKELLIRILAENGYCLDCNNHLHKKVPKEYDAVINYNPKHPLIDNYKAFVDLTIYKSHPNSKQEDYDELNLFPTKKHYQLNFNY